MAAAATAELTTTSRYMDEFLQLESSADFIDLGLFPNAKELSESFAAVAAAREHLADEFSFKEGNTTALCVGDGFAPRLGALIAYRTLWDAISIDPCLCKAPKLTSERHDAWKAVKRLQLETARIQDYSFTKGGKVILFLMHAHVSIEDCLRSIKCTPTAIGIVACPCCDNYLKQVIDGVPPSVVYEDPGVLSPHRQMRVWRSSPVLLAVHAALLADVTSGATTNTAHVASTAAATPAYEANLFRTHPQLFISRLQEKYPDMLQPTARVLAGHPGVMAKFEELVDVLGADNVERVADWAREGQRICAMVGKELTNVPTGWMTYTLTAEHPLLSQVTRRRLLKRAIEEGVHPEQCSLGKQIFSSEPPSHAAIDAVILATLRARGLPGSELQVRQVGGVAVAHFKGMVRPALCFERVDVVLAALKKGSMTLDA